MARLSGENTQRARETIALYPHARSALIPLCHLAQEQDGWLTPEAIEHIAELLELEPADVKGTASFYEMFKLHPVGEYLVNVCTNVSCMLVGAYEMLGGLEKYLGIRRGSTTADSVFTVEEVECIAACTQAPALLVNYRTFGPLNADTAATLMDDLRAGRLAEVVPPHGVTNRVRREVATRRTTSSPAADPAVASPESGSPGPGATGPVNVEPTAPTHDASPEGEN